MLKDFSTIHRQSSIYLDRQLKQFGISSGQFMYIIIACENDGLSQEDIASDLKIDKSSVARTIKQLESDGYVSRVVSSEDKRQYCVYATEKAKQIYSKLVDTLEVCEDYLTEELTDIEVDLLNRLLEKMINRIKNY